MGTACQLPTGSPTNNAGTEFYNICADSPSGQVCSTKSNGKQNLTCLGWTQRNLVDRIMNVVKYGNNNTRFKNVIIELANEGTMTSGTSLNVYLTWYKTVSSWVKSYGGYLVEVSPGPERYTGDHTRKYLYDCTSSTCGNQYAIVPYSKIDLLALHADAWTDNPALGDFKPCASLQRAVNNWSKPVIVVLH